MSIIAAVQGGVFWYHSDMHISPELSCLQLEKNLKTVRDERYRSWDDEFHRLERSDGLSTLRI
jgi:hypothetical protein